MFATKVATKYVIICNNVITSALQYLTYFCDTKILDFYVNIDL